MSALVWLAGSGALSALIWWRCFTVPFPLAQYYLQGHVDYAWITQRIRAVAQRFAKGRIVSCLEGGYSLSALARSVEAHVRVLADL